MSLSPGDPAYSPWADLRSREHLTFVVTRLPMADGWYLSDVPGIALDDRLTRVQRRCVLAHELAHIDLDHHDQVAGCGPGTARLARRNEAAADRLAARRLIRLDDLVGWLPYAAGRTEAAELLDVTDHLLAVRLATLDTRESGILRRVVGEAADAA